MNKGYLIAHFTVTDPKVFGDYVRAADEAVKEFEPKIIAWSGQFENLEGEHHEQHMVFEFKTYEDAKKFYESPAYQAAKIIRLRSASGTFTLVEGTE
ncbi:DUF1330 domain-containing protein [Erwinia billingiae]|jgi:uncharacterized protein (DUF1330 family)|uniref:DUF1330 domain-containing protein n=1 Tax=Erwinia billingiae TaxID=182337 RepID=UPI00320B7E0C